MATGINKVILVGTVGKDPEMKYLPSGQAVCSYSLATNESWRDKDGGRQEKCTWHRIVCFAKLAEICGEHLHKGRQIYVEGKIDNRSYEDKQGQQRTISEVVAREVQFLGAKSETPRQSAAPSSQEQPHGRDNLGYDEPGSDEDLPF